MSFKTVLFLSAGIFISFALLFFISKQQSTSHQAPFELLWQLNPKALKGQGISYNGNTSCAYRLVGPKSILFEESLSALSEVPVSEIKLHFDSFKPSENSSLFVLLKSGIEEKIIHAQKYTPQAAGIHSYSFALNSKEALPSNKLQVVLYSSVKTASCFNGFTIESIAAQR